MIRKAFFGALAFSFVASGWLHAPDAAGTAAAPAAIAVATPPAPLESVSDLACPQAQTCAAWRAVPGSSARQCTRWSFQPTCDVSRGKSLAGR